MSDASSPAEFGIHDGSRTQQGITLALATVLACAVVVLVSGDAWRWPYQYGDDLILEVSTSQRAPPCWPFNCLRCC